MTSKRPAIARAESERLAQSAARKANWQRWGPYLSERQWGTVREDYSPDGGCWSYLSHDHARSRAYRWGEDGLLGFTDRECRLCFALALWNERDPILKERLFGVTGPEGNHGEDVKECYYYLDSLPTYAYADALYKYPQAAFPYEQLISENARRGKLDREFELTDTGVFEGGRYFDVRTEYAKAAPDDIAIRITITNRGPQAARLHVLPTFWFRNTWIWGCLHEGCTLKPRIELARSGPAGRLITDHQTLGRFVIDIGPPGSAPGNEPGGVSPPILFTENETNTQRLFNSDNYTRYVKDAFHRHLIHGVKDAIKPDGVGTKAAAHYALNIAGGASVTLKLRMTREDQAHPTAQLGETFDKLFIDRMAEADAFYDERLADIEHGESRHIARQAYAGLLWTRQFYHYSVADWLDGDPNMPVPPAQRHRGRNADWRHLFNRDVISMPDKWEYPWYAAWDLAFHMLPMAAVDLDFAKSQLVLFLREWYMHPNGQIPAYEFAFGDVNPPVHAWACWRVYKMSGPRGKRDREFLARTFQKLLINFTWWVNRKDISGRHVFSGGFLGLDNIGVFDRSQPLPDGRTLDQADATAWMAFYCGTMLAMAIELADGDSSYEDVASKFFEHFVAIADAMNTLGGCGLWDEQDGFYYDQIVHNGHADPLRVRSMVGLVPLFASEVLDEHVINRLPGFRKRMDWFLRNRADLARHVSYMCRPDRREGDGSGKLLLAIPSQERFRRVLRYMLDESEFLSPFGIRSLSRHHHDKPFTFDMDGQRLCVRYQPGESDTTMFGGNSNWRGPIWFPVNYLIVEALRRYHYFHGDAFQIECPTGSGVMMNLKQVSDLIAARLATIFLPNDAGLRPCHGDDPLHIADPHFGGHILFHEYFHADTGRGLGASHQTGWTALIARLLRKK